MQVEIESEAFAELSIAFDWYAQRSEIAALRFIDELNLAIEKIGKDPGRFARTYADCRQCSLKRFPYSVVYYVDSTTLYVVAIAHAKRRPGYWKTRRS